MKLSIVIPVHNNFNFTKACINDLRKLPQDHEIIIVDNGSSKPDKETHSISDRTSAYIAVLAKEMDRLVSIRNNDVMFLNNDIRVQKNHQTWTEPIITAAQDGLLVGPTGGLLDANLNFVKEEEKLLASKYFYMCGWNLTASKKTWEKLKINNYEGPFTEEFITYFEDVDLSFRARELGIPFKILPVPVFHFKRMTGKQLGLPKLYADAHTKFINKWIGRV